MCEKTGLFRCSREEAGGGGRVFAGKISPRAVATLPFRLAKPPEVASVPRADPLRSKWGKGVRA